VEFKIKGLAQLERRLNKIADNIARPNDLLERVGKKMVASIQTNFKQQGRPEKWSPLKPQTLRRRRRLAGRIDTGGKGKRRGSRRILIDTGWLISSIRYIQFLNGVAAGTSLKQAKRQQFGYPGGKGRGRSQTPARPYVMFQPEDVKDISNIFSRHVRKR
jgi:phage gpG-like protein